MLDERSRNKLSQLHPDLQKILIYVADKLKIEFSIHEGYRTLEEQLKFYNSGASKVKKGKHNEYPSLAADIYPKDWDNSEKSIRQLYFITGAIKATACLLNIKIRQGHDWNQNNETRDESFIDTFHVELV